MSTIIQIKRSTGAGAPTDGILENGELAYSQDGSNNGANAILYIESVESGSNVIHRVGGKYYTAIIESATSVNTPNTLVKRDANGAVNLSVSNATTANSWSVPRYITLGGDLSGNVAIDGSSNVTLTATVINNSVTLGADTTGDYVNNVLAGAGLVASGQGGETANVTLALGVSGVTAGTYGNTSSIPAITVDQYGRITTASNVSIATNLSIAGGTGTDTVSLITDTLTFAGTANEIETTVTNNQVQFGLPNSVTITDNLTVGGNLVINGVVTTLNTAVTVVEDPLLKLGNTNPADSLDLGFFGVYTSSGTKFAGLFRDASDSGKFKLFTGLEGDPDSVPNVVDTSGTGYSIGTLVSNLTGGNVSGLLNPIAVADGGTGRATLTANSIMFPNTTTSFGFATGTSGQVLQLSTTGIPVFGHLDGGTY
jgi:hypothetical protein